MELIIIILILFSVGCLLLFVQLVFLAIRMWKNRV